MNKHPIYFLHIPKTAGTSFISWLKEVSELNACPEGLWSLLLQKDFIEIKGYDLYCGHFYNYLDEYLDRQLNTITFLRNPVDRAHSHFRHVLRDPHHYFHERVVKHASFKNFMLDPITQPLVKNFQVRSLSSKFQPWKIWNAKNKFSSPRYFLEQHIETCDDGLEEKEAIYIAKDALLRCKAFGIVERMTESVSLIANELELSALKEVKCLNIDQINSKLPISEEEYRLADSLLELDMELYEFALRIFDARLVAISLDETHKRGY